MPREADLSTKQTGAQAPPRFPRAPGHCRRPQGAGGAALPRPQETERLTSFTAFDMIRQLDRLRQRADFLAAASSLRVTTPGFIVQGRKRDDAGPCRVGFTVSKKVGSAVERDRGRR